MAGRIVNPYRIDSFEGRHVTISPSISVSLRIVPDGDSRQQLRQRTVAVGKLIDVQSQLLQNGDVEI